MATVKDYKSGKVVQNVKLTYNSLKFVNFPVIGLFIRKKLLETIKTFEPRIISINEASDIILRSNNCALGERVCRVINKDSEFTESIFLNCLADGMIDAGKAKAVEKEAAINALKKYPKNPLILSKVSGEYSEICRSTPEYCVFFNLERCNMKCLNK